MHTSPESPPIKPIIMGMIRFLTTREVKIWNAQMAQDAIIPTATHPIISEGRDPSTWMICPDIMNNATIHIMDREVIKQVARYFPRIIEEALL